MGVASSFNYFTLLYYVDRIVPNKTIINNIFNISESNDTVLGKKKLIEEVLGGREISDMYLKHPANESSSDDEGTENGNVPGEKL